MATADESELFSLNDLAINRAERILIHRIAWGIYASKRQMFATTVLDIPEVAYQRLEERYWRGQDYFSIQVGFLRK